MSDDVDRDIILPSKVNTGIPYKILIDMDKVLSFDKNTHKFSEGKQFKKLSNKNQEKYMFFDLDNDLKAYNERKRLENMIKKLHVHYYLPFYSCNDLNYLALTDCIKKYFSYYNVFICNTTIEGVLINHDTIDLSLKFLEKKKNQYFNEFYEQFQQLLLTDQLNILRIIFNGKSDLLQTQKKYDYNDENKILDNIINKMKIGNKTNGWVTEYIEFFFNSFSIKAPDEINNNSDIKKIFSNHFKELNCIINSLINKP